MPAPRVVADRLDADEALDVAGEGVLGGREDTRGGEDSDDDRLVASALPRLLGEIGRDERAVAALLHPRDAR